MIGTLSHSERQSGLLLSVLLVLLGLAMAGVTIAGWIFTI